MNGSARNRWAAGAVDALHSIRCDGVSNARVLDADRWLASWLDVGLCVERAARTVDGWHVRVTRDTCTRCQRDERDHVCDAENAGAVRCSRCGKAGEH